MCKLLKQIIIYQSDNNPKWTVQIWIGADILFQVVHRCTPGNDCRCDALRHYVRINVEKSLIEFNTENGMQRLWAIVIVDTITCSNVTKQIYYALEIWFHFSLTHLLRLIAAVYLRCAEHLRWHSSN